MFHPCPDAGLIDCENTVPLVFTDLRDRFRIVAGRGVVDRIVEPPVFLDYCVDERCYRRWLPSIDFPELCTTTPVSNSVDCSSPTIGVDIRDDVSSLSREPLDRCPTGFPLSVQFDIEAISEADAEEIQARPPELGDE